MARKYSRKRGKSGSTRVYSEKQPIWVRYKAKEVELLIVKLAKEGMSSSEIGIILRDKYGIPSVKALTEKSILSIMKEKKLVPKLPEDLTNLIKKSIAVKEHMKENNKDQTAKRGFEITESKIRKLVTYYKKNGTIESSWNYNPNSASLYVE